MKNELEYVGFWARSGAALIDILLQLAITVPLTLAVYGRFIAPEGKTFMGLADVIINYLLPAAVVIAFWIYWAATPGKLAMSARIVDADSGLPVTPSQAFIRYAGYFASLLPFGVGYFWVAFDRRKQGWHDKIANTVVIRPTGKEPVQFGQQGNWKGDRIDPA